MVASSFFHLEAERSYSKNGDRTGSQKTRQNACLNTRETGQKDNAECHVLVLFDFLLNIADL